MKYIKLFEDVQDEKYEKFKDDVEKIFEDNNWLVIRPESFYAYCYYGQDQNWREMEYSHTNYSFKNSQIYININKNDNTKIVLNFERGDFYGDDNETVYLKDFLDENNELYNLYGEIVQSNNIVKENGDYWLVVDDYVDFADFFDTTDIREKFIKGVLSGDGFEFFQYDNVFDIDDYGIETDENNFLILKMILFLEKIFNDEDEYDYDLDDIKDYDDICSIIKEYDLEDLEDLLKNCARKSHEEADADDAYNKLTDEIYDFFNLVIENGSPKWQYYKDSKYQRLWIKFKSKSDAGKAKFIFLNYDDSFEDENKIKYSSPYDGYNGDTKSINDYFNEKISERLNDYNNNGIDDNLISEYVEKWKEFKKENPDLTDEMLYSELQLYMDTKKYNI